MAFFTLFKRKMFLGKKTESYNNARGKYPCDGWIKTKVLNHCFKEGIIQDEVYTHNEEVPEQLHPAP